MYWSSIISFLTWPVLIVVSYYVVKIVVKKYETKIKEEVNE